MQSESFEQKPEESQEKISPQIERFMQLVAKQEAVFDQEALRAEGQSGAYKFTAVTMLFSLGDREMANVIDDMEEQNSEAANQPASHE